MFSIFDGIALFLIIVPLNINAFEKLANLGANSKYKLSKDNMLLSISLSLSDVNATEDCSVKLSLLEKAEGYI